MLSKAYFLAKIGADTAENEQHFAEMLPIASTGVAADALAARVERVTPAFGEEVARFFCHSLDSSFPWAGPREAVCF